MKNTDVKMNEIMLEITDTKKTKADAVKRLTSYAEKCVAIREKAGMNKKEFAEYLGIPYRTLQDWELGKAQPPEYVIRLIEYKIHWEKERGNL